MLNHLCRKKVPFFASPERINRNMGWSHLTADEEAKPTKAAKEGGLADLLRSFFLWLIAGGYLIVFAAKTAAVDWGQVYLMDEHKHSAYDGKRNLPL